MSEPAQIEPAKARRKFWQFHLSTAVILSLTSGGMLLANLPMRLSPVNPGSNVVVYERGWPLNIETGGDAGRGVLSHERWILDGILTNVVFAVGMFIVIAIGSEMLIRRREARKS